MGNYLEETKKSIWFFLDNALSTGEIKPADFKGIDELERYIDYYVGSYDICTSDTETARKMINEYPREVETALNQSMTETTEIFDAFRDGEDLNVYFDRLTRMYYFTAALSSVLEERDDIKEAIAAAHFTPII